MTQVGKSRTLGQRDRMDGNLEDFKDVANEALGCLLTSR